MKQKKKKTNTYLNQQIQGTFAPNVLSANLGGAAGEGLGQLLQQQQ